MSLFELYYEYWDENPINDDDLYIGTFESELLAELVRDMIIWMKFPRFKGDKENFHILECNLNMCESIWKDGFVKK